MHFQVKDRIQGGDTVSLVGHLSSPKSNLKFAFLMVTVLFINYDTLNLYHWIAYV